MEKGIVIKYLCTNPSCEFSESVLDDKQPIVFSSGKCSFKTINSCPKCKSGVEMINFVSGSMTIVEDKINQKKEED